MDKYIFRDRSGNELTGAALKRALELRIENEHAVMGHFHAEWAEAERPSKKRECTILMKRCRVEIEALQAKLNALTLEETT